MSGLSGPIRGLKMESLMQRQAISKIVNALQELDNYHRKNASTPKQIRDDSQEIREHIMRLFDGCEPLVELHQGEAEARLTATTADHLQKLAATLARLGSTLSLTVNKDARLVVAITLPEA